MAEAKEIISSVLDENVVSYNIYEKWFQPNEQTDHSCKKSVAMIGSEGCDPL